jgi:nucleotide-binding universal stress UspA family protein
MQTIIVPLDSPDSERALLVARRLANEVSGRIVVVHVARLRPAARAIGPYLRADYQQTQTRLREIVAQLRRDGIPAKLEIDSAAIQHTGDVIAKSAERHKSSVIVMATRGHGAIMGSLRSSVARRLLRAAPCPVLVLTPRSDGEAFLLPRRSEQPFTVHAATG